MKVCHIVENLNTGGLETVVIGLILEQLKNNHECIIICLFEEGELAYKLSGSAVKIFTCGKTSGFDRRTVRRIRKKIDSFSPEVIHTHNNMSHIYACIATIGVNCPIVNTKHGLGAESSKKQAWLFKLTRFKTSQYVFVSKNAMLNYNSRNLAPENKSLVLHNGIDTQVIPKRNVEAKKNFLQKYSISENPVLISMVSRLNKLKDHHTLLLAFSQLLLESEVPCKLVIIGDGPMRDQITNEVKSLNLEDKVLLIGNMPDACLLLQCFDVFVLSSHSEGHSIALLEAAVAGLPLVATNVGGNGEIVNDNIGILVKHKDISELSNALNHLLTDRSARENKGTNASSWANANASIVAMGLSYDKLYNRVKEVSH